MEDIMDFSQETDLKDKLWEKMQSIAKTSAPVKREVSFDSLGGGTAQPKIAQTDPPAATAKKTSKGLNK